MLKIENDCSVSWLTNNHHILHGCTSSARCLIRAAVRDLVSSFKWFFCEFMLQIILFDVLTTELDWFH